MALSQVKLPANDILEIKSVTWSKVSHGLFDYESSSFAIKKAHIQKTSHIYRKENEITVEEALLYPQINATFLTTISVTDEKNYEVLPRNISNPNENKNLNEEVFIIVRSLKNKNGRQNGYVLETGDIIKLGRVEYLILDSNERGIPNTEEDSNMYNSFCEEWQYKYLFSTDEDSSIKKTCRICLSDDECLDESNLFFISPCECKGSCKFVHFACLQSWINSKIVEKSHGNTTNYLWKRFECEVCEKQYPKHIIYGGKKFNLLDIKLPQGPYLLLENISREKKKSKGITIIKSSPNETKLGRGHQCNLRITDISVSRLHAIIKYENEQFLLFDNNSKFGTLVLLKRSLQLSEDKIAVQIGRTVISFSLKNHSSVKKTVKNSDIFMEKNELTLKSDEKEENLDIICGKQEEILNKSDEMDKINPEEDQL